MLADSALKAAAAAAVAAAEVEVGVEAEAGGRSAAAGVATGGEVPAVAAGVAAGVEGTAVGVTVGGEVAAVGAGVGVMGVEVTNEVAVGAVAEVLAVPGGLVVEVEAANAEAVGNSSQFVPTYQSCNAYGMGGRIFY
jgi:hypothetical protein